MWNTHVKIRIYNYAYAAYFSRNFMNCKENSDMCNMDSRRKIMVFFIEIRSLAITSYKMLAEW